jgi:ribosome-associated translation inhibitor RaiA
MRITVSAVGNNPTAGLQTYAVRRIRFGLARFLHQIDLVRISLVEISPRADARVECRIELKDVNGKRLAVSTEGPHPQAAIDEAVDHMRRRVAVELGRARSWSVRSSSRYHRPG